LGPTIAAAPTASAGARAQSLVFPPELAAAFGAFVKSLRSQGVKRLAATAAREVRAGQKIHVRTFTYELADLYTTGDTYDKAVLSAMCIWINLDWDKYGPEKRTAREWADNIYDTADVMFPADDFVWNVAGRITVERIVRSTQIAYYSPGSAKAYWIACGKKR
jgi:hypothetical protein